jgi:hypothetical protein
LSDTSRLLLAICCPEMRCFIIHRIILEADKCNYRVHF